MTQRRKAPARDSASRRSPARPDGVALLALTDRIYQAGPDNDATAKWLIDLGRLLDGERLALEDDRGEEIVTTAEIAASRPRSGPRAKRTPRRAAAAVERFPVGQSGITLVVETSGGLSAAGRHVLEGLMPHLARARGIVGEAPATLPLGNIPAVALDHMAVGVVIVDERGALLHANRAGQRMLEIGEGVEQTADQIVVQGRPAAEILEDLRSRAGDGRRSRPSARISVDRGDRSALEVFAVSVDDMGVGEESALALFVSDPESGLEPPPSVLREHYGLSRRESEVVGQILLGHSLDEAATALGIHRETIRMHLKQVFRKVGTRRQVDLVRLLLTGVPRLRWD